jgi:hypothetical protein
MTILALLLPPLSLGERLIWAWIVSFLVGWLVIRARRADRMAIRLLRGIFLAALLVSLLWLAETTQHPSYWQRNGLLSFLVGCFAGFLAGASPAPIARGKSNTN